MLSSIFGNKYERIEGDNGSVGPKFLAEHKGSSLNYAAESAHNFFSSPEEEKSVLFPNKAHDTSTKYGTFRLR